MVLVNIAASIITLMIYRIFITKLYLYVFRYLFMVYLMTSPYCSVRGQDNK